MIHNNVIGNSKQFPTSLRKNLLESFHHENLQMDYLQVSCKIGEMGIKPGKQAYHIP